MTEQCWAHRKEAWRQSTEFRCQRRQGHSGPHRHTYKDGIVEWGEDGIEKITPIL